jgi:signal transduction histidine kinase/CheY-like chemotaxis protein
MTAPIQILMERAMRIGEGRLDQRVEIATGDELQALADQFNRMADRLRDSHAGLEHRIEERTRELAAANAAKSRFLAVASHDLRQPMHALGLFVAQLKETHSAGERDRLLGSIEASSEAVSELLDALLDISKLDAGAVIPHPTEFEVQLLFDRLDHGFSVDAQAKGLRLRFRPSSLRVKTDPLLLERILSNLITNAVRYTSEGGALIACRRRDQTARIEVWDTGSGIPADELGRIFDEFYQARALASERSKGLGLGLAIVKRLAQLLDLSLRVRSIEGCGSLFAIDVPLAPSVPRIAVAKEARALGLAGFDGALALVVGDDHDAREALAGLLRQWGWRVITAESGDQALAALGDKRLNLDIVITDYRLASSELGTHVIERIRATCGSDIPAIVMSGDVTTDLRESMQRVSLQLLHKPLRPAKLRALLHHLHARRATVGAANG